MEDKENVSQNDSREYEHIYAKLIEGEDKMENKEKKHKSFFKTHKVQEAYGYSIREYERAWHSR